MIGHFVPFNRKQSLFHLANLSSKETFLVRTVHAPVRVLMTQEIMHSGDAQRNTKETP